MKYLIAILLLFFSLSAFSQVYQEDTTKYMKNPAAYPSQLRGFWATSILRVPDTTNNRPQQGVPGAMGRNTEGTKVFMWDGSAWVAGGGVTVDSVLITSIDSIFITNTDSIFIVSGNDTIFIGNGNPAVDTIYQRGDSIFAVKSGIEFLAALSGAAAPSGGMDTAYARNDSIFGKKNNAEFLISDVQQHIDSLFITNTDSIFIITGNDTIFIGSSNPAMDTAYQRGDSLFGVKNNTEFLFGLTGGAPTGVPGTKDTLWYNVKWFGAIGDGVTDDRAAIQSANDYVSAVKGGYIWFPAGVYKVSAPVYRASYVNWEGVKDSSIIKNFNPTHVTFGDQSVMWMGNYNPSAYDTTVGRFFRGHMGTIGNKMQIVDSISKFNVGDVVVIEGMTGWESNDGHWKPYVVRYNEIDSIYADTVVFHYQVDTILTNARINISGHFIDPNDGIDGNGHVKYLVRNVTTRNMVFESEGQWILGMSSLGCTWANIRIKAAELFTGNGMAWMTANNIYGQWWRQVSEFAIGCHNTTITGVNAHYINRFDPDEKPYIKFGENVHAVVLKDVFIDAGNFPGKGIWYGAGTECIVDGIHVTSQNIRQTHIEFSDNDLGDAPAAFVNNNVLRHGYFKNSGNLQNYILMTKSTSAGQLKNNVVSDVTFIGPVADATALTIDGYRSEFKDLYITEGEITGGDSLYKGIISGGSIANVYDIHGNDSNVFIRSVFDTAGKNRSHFTDITLKYIPDNITIDGQLHYNESLDQLNFRHNGTTTDLLSLGGSTPFQHLTNGYGILPFDYDGSAPQTVTVDSSILNGDLFVDSSTTEFFVDTISASPPVGALSGATVLVAHTGATGAFATHEDQVATLTGAVWSFQIAAAGDNLVLSNDTQPTTFYQFDGSIWHLRKRAASIGGDAIGANYDLGTNDNQNFRFFTNGFLRERISSGGQHYFRRYVGITSNNYLKIADTATGRMDFDTFVIQKVKFPIGLNEDTIYHRASGVTAGSYTNTNLTVDSMGHITAASNGAGGGGSGTVTSFSAGNLSPLFTTSVATATTTPALTFALSNASANTVFGNATGSSAAPSFGQIVNGQITNATIVASTKLSATGTPSATTVLYGNDTWGALAGLDTLEITPNLYAGLGYSDTKKIQLALDLARSLRRPLVIPWNNERAANLWMIDSAVLLGSNSTIVIRNSKLKLTDSSRDNIFRTSNCGFGITTPGSTPMTNISITGTGSAILEGADNPRSTGDKGKTLSTTPLTDFTQSYGTDAGKAGRTQTGDWRNYGLIIAYTTGVTFSGVALNYLHAYGASFERCVNVDINNVSVTMPGYAANGDTARFFQNNGAIDLSQGAKQVTVTNAYGFAQDDFIATNILNVSGGAGSYGTFYPIGDTSSVTRDSISNINVSNINGGSFANIVRVLVPPNGIKAHDFNINNIRNNLKASYPYYSLYRSIITTAGTGSGNGVMIGSLSGVYGGANYIGQVSRFNINNVTADSCNYGLIIYTTLSESSVSEIKRNYSTAITNLKNSIYYQSDTSVRNVTGINGGAAVIQFDDATGTSSRSTLTLNNMYTGSGSQARIQMNLSNSTGTGLSRGSNFFVTKSSNSFGLADYENNAFNLIVGSGGSAATRFAIDNTGANPTFSTATATFRVKLNNSNASPNTGISLQSSGTDKWTLFSSTSISSNFSIFNHNLSATAITVTAALGNVGIRQGTPTAALHLPAGTATASTAPLKFASGTNLTTAEDGAVEYDGTSLFFTNSGARRQELPQIQQSRVSTQFDKTSSAALANVTGLTATLVAGKVYRFEAILYTTSNVAGGVQFAIAGTATATNIIYEAQVIDANANAAQTRATALSTAVGGVTAVTNAYCRITGTITVNAAGTLTVQFAQNVSNGTASSVLVGSTFVVTQIP